MEFNINVKINRQKESGIKSTYVSTKEKRKILKANGFIFKTNLGWYLGDFLWGVNADEAYEMFIGYQGE